MVFDVHVLGTSSARPTPERAVSGSLVKGPDGIAVIDAGEGFQSRFMHQRRRMKHFAKGDTIKPSNVGVLAFTHGHLDHTWGALPWLQSMDLEHRTQPLLVIGPTSSTAIEVMKSGSPFPEEVPSADLARQFVAWLALGGDMIRFPIRWVLGDVEADRWVEIDTATNLVMELDAMPQPEGWKRTTLTPCPTHHSIPSCGWMLEQSPTDGTFDRARADELKLTTKQRARLARGEDVKAVDGTMLEASWFRGEGHPSVSVLLSGDTASCPPGWPVGLAPTLLIHEATFLNEQQEKAHEHLHSTAAGAAQTARAIGASYLALTHYSNRIKNTTASVEEARAVAEGLPLVALDDGDRLRVRDDGSVAHLVLAEDGWKRTNIPPNR